VGFCKHGTEQVVGFLNMALNKWWAFEKKHWTSGGLL
jgi:hypothetical protein